MGKQSVQSAMNNVVQHLGKVPKSVFQEGIKAIELFRQAGVGLRIYVQNVKWK